MAESSSISIPSSSQPTPSATRNPPQTTTTTQSNPTTGSIVVDKTLSSTANLVKLLPSGTVLAFQSLSPIFSNHGNCRFPNKLNKLLTIFLIAFSTVTCCLLSFTDSFVASNGKHYYGLATFRGLYVINSDSSEDYEADNRLQSEARRCRLRFVDVIHAFLSSLLFLSLAFSDSDVQKCLLPGSVDSVLNFFMNLPIGVGLLASLVFMIFPTSRRSIGYTEHPNA